jgi:hypothetical protein
VGISSPDRKESSRAHETGSASCGLNVILPHEQCANPYVDKSVEFRYFFTRKVMLVKYSCAFIIMPGGRRRITQIEEKTKKESNTRNQRMTIKCRYEALPSDPSIVFHGILPFCPDNRTSA